MHITNTEGFYQEIGSRIRNARLMAAISQDVLATQLGLTRASIINIEKGRHKPSVHQLLEIASILMVQYISLIPSKVVSDTSVKPSTFDLKKVITDQEKIDKTTKATVQKFLQSINKY